MLHDASWCFMMLHGASWCFMVLHDASWCFHCDNFNSWQATWAFCSMSAFFISQPASVSEEPSRFGINEACWSQTEETQNWSLQSFKWWTCSNHTKPCRLWGCSFWCKQQKINTLGALVQCYLDLQDKTTTPPLYLGFRLSRRPSRPTSSFFRSWSTRLEEKEPSEE